MPYLLVHIFVLHYYHFEKLALYLAASQHKFNSPCPRRDEIAPIPAVKLPVKPQSNLDVVILL